MKEKKKNVNSSILRNEEKYSDVFFIQKYVALWAYGYQNGLGGSEALYRTINELGFSVLDSNSKYRILDIGCGVGRTTRDYARQFKNSTVVGIDDSSLMIDMALQIDQSGGLMTIDMSRVGFGLMTIRESMAVNSQFKNISLEKFQSKESDVLYDLIVAVNFFDRIDNVSVEMRRIYDMVKPSGYFILSTPLNFIDVNDWLMYGSYNSFKKVVNDVGFIIDVSFDNLCYREILDERGAMEEYPTIVMRLKKKYE